MSGMTGLNFGDKGRGKIRKKRYNSFRHPEISDGSEEKKHKDSERGHCRILLA